MKIPVYLAFVVLFIQSHQAIGQVNYLEYHRTVIRSERLISEQKNNEAIYLMDSLFRRYNFVFLRECKLASAIAVFEQDSAAAIFFVKRGILQGWTWNSIRKDKNLKALHNYPEWNDLATVYDSLHGVYLKRIDRVLKQEIYELFKQDQKMALKAFLKIGEKSRTKYAERKFAPHSEEQMEVLDKILIENGYPGEKLIGNGLWTSVILSHHNSISTAYAKNDTIYSSLRPGLVQAIKEGELNPYEFATIEDWRTISLYSYDTTSYGYLGKIRGKLTLENVSRNRSAIGIRPIELRNVLIDVEQTTGLNLYLPKGWQKGKIAIAN